MRGVGMICFKCEQSPDFWRVKRLFYSNPRDEMTLHRWKFQYVPMFVSQVSKKKVSVHSLDTSPHVLKTVNLHMFGLIFPEFHWIKAYLRRLCRGQVFCLMALVGQLSGKPMFCYEDLWYWDDPITKKGANMGTIRCYHPRTEKEISMWCCFVPKNISLLNKKKPGTHLRIQWSTSIMVNWWKAKRGPRCPKSDYHHSFFGMLQNHMMIHKTMDFYAWETYVFMLIDHVDICQELDLHQSKWWMHQGFFGVPSMPGQKESHLGLWWRSFRVGILGIPGKLLVQSCQGFRKSRT